MNLPGVPCTVGGVKRPPQLDDPEWLHREYLDNGRSTEAIAAEVGCVGVTVTDALRRHGIEVRPQGPTSHPLLDDPEWLHREYLDKARSSGDIAAEVGRQPNAVLGALARHGIERRPAGKGIEELRDAGWLTERYVDWHWSTTRIAGEVGCSAQMVSKALRRAGIVPRRNVGANTTGTNSTFRNAVARHAAGGNRAPVLRRRPPDPARHLLVRVDRGWVDPAPPLLLVVAPHHTFSDVACQVAAERDVRPGDRPEFRVGDNGAGNRDRSEAGPTADLAAPVCSAMGPGWHAWLVWPDSGDPFSVRGVLHAPHPQHRSVLPDVVAPPA